MEWSVWVEIDKGGGSCNGGEYIRELNGGRDEGTMGWWLAKGRIWRARGKCECHLAFGFGNPVRTQRINKHMRSFEELTVII